MGDSQANGSVPSFSLASEALPAATDASTSAEGGAAPTTNTNPEGSQPTSGNSPSNAFKVLEGGKFAFGDSQYTDAELVPILEAGVKASDLHKASTARFQEAKELQAQVQLEMQKNQHLNTIAENLAAMPKDAAEAIFAFAREIDQAVSAGKPIPRPGEFQSSVAAAANQAFSIPQDFKPESRFRDFDALTDEGQAIVAAFAPSMQRLAQLEARMQEMGAVLPEVQTFVKGSREERQMQTAIATIKQEHGLDVTGAELAQAVRETGISNPHAAYVFAHRAQIASNAANAAAVASGQKPLAPPAGGNAKTFDPSGMTPEQIMANLNAGLTMAE